MTTQTTKPKAAKRGLLERLDNDAVVCAEVRYIRLCCGAAPHHIRAVAEAIGRTTASSRYSPDMSKHAFFGTDAAIPEPYKGRRGDI